MKKSNTDYWNSVGSSYNDKWAGGSMMWMDNSEKDFIIKSLKSLNKVDSVSLDIGSGNGRIVDFLIELGFTHINAVDASIEMVSFLKEKYKKNDNVESTLKINSMDDVSGKYDLITAIRVLKYNETWKEYITKSVEKLNSGGVFIFTFPNKYSLSYFAKNRYPVKTYITDRKELEDLLKEMPVDIMAFQTMYRLPDIFYHSRILGMLKVVPVFEKILSLILGPIKFGRLFFVAIKKR